MSNTIASKPAKHSAIAYVPSKITEHHLQLDAALYVRQSSTTQLREHQESTARQYALSNRLVAFGWTNDAITVIDDDLGISGSGKADRPGFRRLLKLITDGQVGIVLGLEMSRLARNSKDWADLFEVCAIYGTLIADEDAVAGVPVAGQRRGHLVRHRCRLSGHRQNPTRRQLSRLYFAGVRGQRGLPDRCPKKLGSTA